MESVLACRTEGQLRAQVSSHAEAFGFSTWVYVAKPNLLQAPPYVLSSFPTSWITPRPELIAADSDVAIARCRDTSTPFVWTSKFSDEELDRVCPSFFRHPSNFGLGAGINVPVHGLGCQWSMLSFATPGHLRSGRALLHQMGSIVLLASLAHQAARELALRSVGEPKQQLTPREAECLRWAAHGKTGWEISRLLGITERTVIFHMDNAVRKLGVSGRRQAVARAIALNLIAI